MSIKARLRAWLIELVREAIRAEAVKDLDIKQDGRAELAYDPYGNPRTISLPYARETALQQANSAWSAVRADKYMPQSVPFGMGIASKPVTPTMTSEPSFEQMQAQAIQEQEKFYANEADPPRSTHA